MQHNLDYSIPMRFGHHDIQFRWLPTAVMMLSVTLFVALGIWQLGRAEEKRQQATELEGRSLLPPYELGPLEASAEPLRYRRLIATGTFEAEGQLLIENRHYGGKTGYHVITPLRLDSGGVRVLVNRGWIPADTQGQPTESPVPAGSRTLVGDAYIPSAPAMTLSGAADVTRWGERWPFLTLELYRTRFVYPIQPVVILMDPAATGGFVRDWPREMPKEGMHLGYAIQWFAFGVIALLIWMRLSVRRTGQEVL